MIDFKDNGGFKVPDANSLTGHAIIGLGSAGMNIVDQLVLDHHSNTALFGFDTDEQVVRGSVLDDKMLLGEQRIHGLGTGGDPSLAAEIACDERLEITEMLQGIHSAVLVMGLGGGTGSGMALEFTRILRQLGATVVVVAVTPFDFEGKRRQNQAREALTQVNREADAVLCLSNSRLLRTPGRDTDIRHGFATMNGLVGRACVNLRAVLNQKGPMQIHLSDLKNLLAEYDYERMELENCWTGYGTACGSERIREVVDEVLGGPLFTDQSVWDKGAALIACLNGGHNFSMGEFQSILEYLKREIPVELPILAGTVLHEENSDTIGLTLMVIGRAEVAAGLSKPRVGEELVFDAQRSTVPPQEVVEPVAEMEEEEEMPAVTASRVQLPEATKTVTESQEQLASQQYFVQQEELPLDKKIYRGRFEKSAPTIFNGEDLDQPTFMRQNIKIRL